MLLASKLCTPVRAMLAALLSLAHAVRGQMLATAHPTWAPRKAPPPVRRWRLQGAEAPSGMKGSAPLMNGHNLQAMAMSAASHAVPPVAHPPTMPEKVRAARFGRARSEHVHLTSCVHLYAALLWTAFCPALLSLSLGGGPLRTARRSPAWLSACCPSTWPAHHASACVLWSLCPFLIAFCPALCGRARPSFFLRFSSRLSLRHCRTLVGG